jgi:hypothetical protein
MKKARRSGPRFSVQSILGDRQGNQRMPWMFPIINADQHIDWHA